MGASPERDVGIEGYSSSHPGINGSIKQDVSDFVVEEITDPSIERNESGKYHYLKVRLTDWDTNRFISRLARDLHISRKRISFAGTKDKRGVTAQYFCINADFSPEGIRIADVELLEHFRSDHFLRLGDLIGNRFLIRISSDSDKAHDINEIHQEIVSNGGFPNFFGMQRFGSIRRNTHKIGRMIVHGEYSRAVETYLYDPEFDREDFRINYNKTQDTEEALREFPMHLGFERSLLGYILEHGEVESAFNVFPKNLGMLLVHAYQSYLFNRVLSERMRQLGNLMKAVPGDLVYAVDHYFNPVDKEEIKVNHYNTEKINRMIGEDRLRPTIPLIGYESKTTGNFQGEIESRIMDEEKLEFSDFRIGLYPELSSSGDRRIISAKPQDFLAESENRISFSLGRGMYATCFVREFLKNP